MEKSNDILVSVCCITYNQVFYIRQCLDGFLMQKTNFKFEVIIHDDCSTDGTTDVIREYVEKYPDLIKPIFQERNQYQNGCKRILATFVYPKVQGKYIALCEGDDYWTDPLKLQKQVDFLESHPDYSMACNSTGWYSQRCGYLKRIGLKSNKDKDLKIKNIIIRGGLYISTCSLIFRKIILDNYPDYCKRCHVGDFPLQIWAAMQGKVRCFHDVMSIYRVDNPASWVGKQKASILSDNSLNGILSEIRMLQGFANDFPKYKKYFDNRIKVYIISKFPNKEKDFDSSILYMNKLSPEINKYGWFLKFLLRKNLISNHYLLSFYVKLTHLLI